MKARLGNVLLLGTNDLNLAINSMLLLRAGALTKLSWELGISGLKSLSHIHGRRTMPAHPASGPPLVDCSIHRSTIRTLERHILSVFPPVMFVICAHSGLLS